LSAASAGLAIGKASKALQDALRMLGVARAVTDAVGLGEANRGVLAFSGRRRMTINYGQCSNPASKLPRSHRS
jgi:hypothetical protein